MTSRCPNCGHLHTVEGELVCSNCGLRMIYVIDEEIVYRVSIFSDALHMDTIEKYTKCGCGREIAYDVDKCIMCRVKDYEPVKITRIINEIPDHTWETAMDTLSKVNIPLAKIESLLDGAPDDVIDTLLDKYNLIKECMK